MTDVLDARFILWRMAHVYSGCRSYRDRGEVESPGHRTIFSTAFIRPNQFRFEFSEAVNSEANSAAPYPFKRHMIICQRNADTQVWWELPANVPKPESLTLGIAAATAVSDGAAHTVPSLLMPQEICGRSVGAMTSPLRCVDTRLGTKDCYRIEGRFVGHPITVWIERTSYLILRKESDHSQEDGAVVRTTTNYEPNINVEVTFEELAFNPPS